MKIKFWLKKILVKRNLVNKNFCLKKFLVKRNICSKNMFGLKHIYFRNILVQKYFGSKKFKVQKVFCPKKLRSKKCFVQKLFGQIKIGAEKIWTQNNLRSKTRWSQEPIYKVWSKSCQWQLRYSWYGQMSQGQMLPEQMSLWHLEYVKKGLRNLPLKLVIIGPVKAEILLIWTNIARTNVAGTNVSLTVVLDCIEWMGNTLLKRF